MVEKHNNRAVIWTCDFWDIDNDKNKDNDNDKDNDKDNENAKNNDNDKDKKKDKHHLENALKERPRDFWPLSYLIDQSDEKTWPNPKDKDKNNIKDKGIII